MGKLGPYEVNTIVVGDCLEVLRQVPDGVFQMCATSPPYWGLRDYGIPPVVHGGDPLCEHEWGVLGTIHTGGVQKDEHGGQRVGRDFSAQNAVRDRATGQFCHKCNAWLGSLGLEPTPELYVEHIVEVFREVRRVLRDDGTLWLNMGDSYWGGKGQSGHADPEYQAQRVASGQSFSQSAAHVGGRGKTRPSDGRHPILKPKDLIGIPWRVAMALVDDGWWLRSDIIWAKPNCMPESVRDRPTKSHEYVFLMSKSKTYFYDQDAIREPHVDPADIHRRIRKDGEYKHGKSQRGWMQGSEERADRAVSRGRNKRTVWTIPTHPFPEAHFATFPPKLVEPMIKAGTSERGACPECGKAWVRMVEKRERGDTLAETPGTKNSELYVSRYGAPRLGPGIKDRTITIGWQPACDCWKQTTDCLGVPTPEDPIPCIVLDPFAGAGTTLMVADGLKRDWLGIEINSDYVGMALARIAKDRVKRQQLEMF